jgi:hypothetical protein
MKSFGKILLAGALMLLTMPAAAMAYDGCYGGFHGGYYGGYRPGAYAYRDMRYRQYDVARDRYRLHRDLELGDWRAARAQRADMYHDYNQMRRDRFDMNYGY